MSCIFFNISELINSWNIKNLYCFITYLECKKKKNNNVFSLKSGDLRISIYNCFFCHIWNLRTSIVLAVLAGAIRTCIVLSLFSGALTTTIVLSIIWGQKSLYCLFSHWSPLNLLFYLLSGSQKKIVYISYLEP